jgi:endoglucanase
MFKLGMVILMAAVIFFAAIFLSQSVKTIGAAQILKKTWLGYKHFFVEKDGRVKRIRDQDTVSEGQAYCLLRAVWMDDKETFDRCYQWTEENLSRKKEKGDHLLAWQWKDGKIADWMPASDADCDYALSLLFAHARWQEKSPAGQEAYLAKAKKVLTDILNLETYVTASGRLYLSPWILEEKASRSLFPVNPSYYSPAHFRIFYLYTQDERWKLLIDTAYYLLGALAKQLGNDQGVGLIPDWCSVDNTDQFFSLAGKNSGFGWEAVRAPLRVGLDFFWFKNEAAEKIFACGLKQFIENEWEKKKKVFCEYTYQGKVKIAYENPLFYAAYSTALAVGKSPYTKALLEKSRSFLQKSGGFWVYQNANEYYVNSLAWFAEGLEGGVIKNLAQKDFR